MLEGMPWVLIKLYWRLEEPIVKYIDRARDRREGITERIVDIRPAERQVRRMKICRSYGHPDMTSGATSSSQGFTETMKFCPICGISSRSATYQEHCSLFDCVVDQ